MALVIDVYIVHLQIQVSGSWTVTLLGTATDHEENCTARQYGTNLLMFLAYNLPCNNPEEWGSQHSSWSLTYSMEQSPSWEANQFLASQEIALILRNLKVDYRVYKSPLPVPILGQINPVHAPHPTFWRSILILSSHLCLCLPSGSFPQVSPPKPCIHLSSPPYTLHSLPISFFLIWSLE